ncbi:hypothetical protein [Lyngbya aestuarii]|uniref:hypothetical protein n=1 Tax=Lyngbya aestuarii TaxID=118322 RepID=UPI00403E210C
MVCSNTLAILRVVYIQLQLSHVFDTFRSRLPQVIQGLILLAIAGIADVVEFFKAANKGEFCHSGFWGKLSEVSVTEIFSCLDCGFSRWKGETASFLNFLLDS